MAKKKSAYVQKSIFTKLTTLFFNNKALSALFLGAIIILGGLSYTTFLRREGFPAVQIPTSIGVGRYFVDDASQVDDDVAAPLGEFILALDEVKSVQTTASENTFTIFADLESGTTNAEGNEIIAKAVAESGLLLDGKAELEMLGIDAAKFLGEYNVLTSVYAQDDLSVEELTEQTTGLISDITSLGLVEQAEVIDQFTVNPADANDRYQSSFTRAYDPETKAFKKAITIGIAGVDSSEFDIFDLDDQLKVVLDNFNSSTDLTAVNTADTVKSVSEDISSLQSNVLWGAAIVMIISALMISIRVSVLTSIFIVAVLFVTIGVLLVIGYTLNVITLFSLVLALGLFVDDATIIAESIYANKDPKKKPVDVVKSAINSIGTASFSGTLTTALVFSPLLFITGILGGFIFQMPMTVIISLLVSFFLSITFIPLLANYTMLGEGVKARKPNIIGMFLANMIEKLRKSLGAGLAWGISMVLLSFGLIAAGIFLFGTLTFDIFPAGKDGNNLAVTIEYPEGTSIEEAEEIAAEVDAMVVDELGLNIDRAQYGAQQGSDASNAAIDVELLRYQDRDITSVEMAENIETRFAGYERAEVATVAANGGPPEAEYPLLIQVDVVDDVDKSAAVGNEIISFLQSESIELANGDIVKVSETVLGNLDDVVRKDGTQQLEVRAKFDTEGTTGIVADYTSLIEKEFTDDKLAANGLSSENIAFDLGDDSDFQESFNSLPIAGLGALIVMIILLTLQFRSLVKPALILIALPFSFFGIALGLNLSDNPLSFFSMIGIIGLIGIAVNNTILLVDNATHHEQEGMGPVGAIAQAMRERFRPLATTTLTTIAALTPLFINNPFWESLSISIIGGLASSTVLVVLAFPFYYLLSSLIERLQKAYWRDGFFSFSGKSTFKQVAKIIGSFLINFLIITIYALLIILLVVLLDVVAEDAAFNSMLFASMAVAMVLLAIGKPIVRQIRR